MRNRLTVKVTKFQHSSANRFEQLQKSCLGEGEPASSPYKLGLILFYMGFFELSVMRGGHHAHPHHNFVVIASMVMEFGTGIKLNVFFTMVAEKFVTLLLLCNFNVITRILADA